MVEKNKTSRRLILFVIIPLIILIIISGIFITARYVPSFNQALILATTVKPEAFTELYFEDHLSLPGKIVPGKENIFSFTVHNLENRDMQYSYEVYLDQSGAKQAVDSGSFLIKNNEYKTVIEKFKILLPASRIKVVVDLKNKNQQIDFWMDE
jgi:hypothetical protein